MQFSAKVLQIRLMPTLHEIDLDIDHLLKSDWSSSQNQDIDSSCCRNSRKPVGSDIGDFWLLVLLGLSVYPKRYHPHAERQLGALLLHSSWNCIKSTFGRYSAVLAVSQTTQIAPLLFRK